MPCFLIGATGPGVTSTGEALIGSVSDDPYLFRTWVRAVLPAGRLAESAGLDDEKTRTKQAHIGSELRWVDARSDLRRGDEVTLVSGTEDLPPPFEYSPGRGQPSRAVNAAGLAFTVALAVERDEERKEDELLEVGKPSSTIVPFEKLCHAMMDCCSSVDDAIELLVGKNDESQKRQIVPGLAVLLADASGNLAHVEVGKFGCAVKDRYSRDNPGVVIGVNCHQSNEMVRYNKGEAQLNFSSKNGVCNNNGRRLTRGWQLAEKYRGKIDVSVIARILADHENRDIDCAENPLIPFWGYSICNHGTCKKNEYDPRSPPWGSVSAEIMQPSKRTFHYCYGWACGEKQPIYGDQVFQKHSWGRFLGFALPERFWCWNGNNRRASVDDREDVVQCTTVHGDVTEEGKAFIKL